MNATLPQEDWTGLTHRARGGDRAAFGELYRLTEHAVYGMLRHMVRSDEVAEDLAQETYVDAWRRLGSLRDPGAFRSWLFQIALNKARDHLRRRRWAPESLDARIGEDAGDEPPDPNPGPEPIVLAAERSRKVHEAMGELSPEHREAVALYYLGGLDVPEMMRVLGLPKGTVVSRLARARAQMRRRLAPYLEDGDELH